jgi:hypothetical protein
MQHLAQHGLVLAPVAEISREAFAQTRRVVAETSA